MEDLVDTKKTFLTDNKYVRTQLSIDKAAARTIESDEMVQIIRAEGGESLYNYVEWLGVINEPEIIVLSSQRHYYYDEDDLKSISAVVNLKQLNQIKNLEEFFETIFRLIPQGSKFVGSFAENGKYKNSSFRDKSSLNGSLTTSEAAENGIISRNPFLNIIYSLIDLKTNRYMTKRSVEDLFTTCGFKILDMTDLNGLTYFLAQKTRPVAE